MIKRSENHYKLRDIKVASCEAKVGGREGVREREGNRERDGEKEKYIQFGREASTLKLNELL